MPSFSQYIPFLLTSLYFSKGQGSYLRQGLPTHAFSRACLHSRSDCDGFEGACPQACTKLTPSAGPGKWPQARPGCPGWVRAVPAAHPAPPLGAPTAKGLSAAPAVHIPGRNQLEEAWKARPFYSPELRLWLAAGTRPKLHLKCFRQPICTGFGSLRSACCGPLLSSGRRKPGGKQGWGAGGGAAPGAAAALRPRAPPLSGCPARTAAARGARPAAPPPPWREPELRSPCTRPWLRVLPSPYPHRPLWFFTSTSW